MRRRSGSISRRPQGIDLLHPPAYIFVMCRARLENVDNPPLRRCCLMRGDRLQARP
jgi:hypothetical protein